MPNGPDSIQISQALAALDQLPIVELTMDPMTAWCVLGSLQLALRHPGHKGASAKIAERFARAIQASIAPPGTELGRLAERGWHAVFDVPREGG